MNYVPYVLALFIILLGGCARVSFESTTVVEVAISDNYKDGVVLFSGNIDDLVSPDTGLTTHGCELFFKGKRSVCLTDWHQMSYDDKVSFFYLNSTVFVRGALGYRREELHLDDLGRIDPEMPIAERYSKLKDVIAPQTALKCVQDKQAHEDFCLLYFEPFVFSSEISKALAHWAQMEYRHAMTQPE